MHPILRAFRSDAVFHRLEVHRLKAGGRLSVGGLAGSTPAALVAALHEVSPERVLVAVCNDPVKAAAFEADLDSLLGIDVAYLYPQREALPYETGEPHLEIGGLRVEAVEALFGGSTRLLVTTARALQERAPIPADLAELRLTLRVGEEPGFRKLVETLRSRGFEERPVVEEVGQFAVRGGLIDLFSFGSPDPLRVEFWGDEIQSIRAFDILDQRSTEELDSAYILPVGFRTEDPTETVNRSLLELLPAGTVLFDTGDTDWVRKGEEFWEHATRLHDEMRTLGRTVTPPHELFLSPDSYRSRLEALARVRLTPRPEGDFIFESHTSPEVQRDMSRLTAVIREGRAGGEDVLILCDNDGQLERLEEIIETEIGAELQVTLAVGSVHQGFLLPGADPPLRVLTDHEIFQRARRIRRRRRFRGAVALESLAQLSIGDPVVHMDHGIGRFQGLERVTVGGQEIESLKIEYADGELLRVPVYRLDLVERWIGETSESKPPPLHKIGGKRWKAARHRTEQAVEEMTAELVQLYARRSQAKGFAFSADTRWQREMESSFLYEDTPDQRSATLDVKRDMQSPRPMDRLICGDVGYGKTEVAIRAAFKAVQDGKQIAFLAPTTILVEQHRHTFEERLADYPVTVGALSRFRTPKEQSDILKRLGSGELDIVIGTHRLLSDDVLFHDLGLIIVDEEQRFGVRHKEKLKRFRSWIDVLTLSATPIPRTLYLSMSGIRDLSLIRTPPRDRMPILTHVLPWSDQLIGEAVHRELDRGGQIFFLHNAIETIHNATERLRRLAPDTTIEVAHGQMAGGELDRVMHKFVNGEVEILVCTTIIENGLDVPNANTLIVNGADHFGLSQLYQIRGRVGRSDRRAYCYLVVPDRVNDEAERRLKVLEHYTDLGSGFAVARRDLEFRGSGSLLGSDQSGFAQQVGLDTYFRLLEKTVKDLGRNGQETDHPPPEISLDGSAYLPETYISDSGQKLGVYRRISKLKNREEVEGLRLELADRFGPLPTELGRLLHQATLQIAGTAAGLERLIVRGSSARLNFREGVVPPISFLEPALRDHLVEVEVRRMSPLSLILRNQGTTPVEETVLKALAALSASAQTAGSL